MDMSGERRIPAPRQRVWDALNDPAVLQASIPGCTSLEKTSDNTMKATAAVKIGPIQARFTGNVQLTDLDPPNSYRIGGEGQGGVAGFAKGGASVHLSDDGAFTLLKYEVQAQVGGKIAQLGARLIDATAKQMADQFFDRFSNEVSAPTTVAADGPAAAIASVLPAAATPAMATGGAKTPEEATARAVHPNAVAPASVSIFKMIPELPFGLPRVAVGGIIIYALIFILIFKGYVGL